MRRGRVTYEVWSRDEDGIGFRRVVAVFDDTVSQSRADASAAALWRAGFDGRHGLAVPEALGVVPLLGARLQGEIDGRPLDRIEAEEAVVAASRAGVWLATLHRRDLGGPTRVVADTRASLERARSILTRCAASHRARVDNVIERLHGGLTPHRPGSPTHGAFGPSKVYVGSAITVDDLGGFALGEPERDLGSFLAEGLVSALSGSAALPDIAARNAAFLTGYGHAGGRGSLGRLGLWSSVSLIERLAVLAEESPLPNRHWDGWLAMCERGLSQAA